MDEHLKFEERWMPLPLAAQKLGRSWPQTWRLVLSGELEARQGANGRWMVSRASLDEARKLGAAREEGEAAGEANGETAEAPAE